ncbi:unannotated protein [freshwater metagenome]|uniref:Unannotated protein n=1 Tax=freshwater metagenome TaxID=449393 RepID=A0A6J7K351_9ZZZZ|nr:DUF3027 domain-containing protein [Actinomycetota bacterium]
MTKTTKVKDETDFAREVLTTEKLPFGAFMSSVDEGDDTFSYHFKCELKGYLDWHWSVTLHQPAGLTPTLSEFVLLPGETSLVAPDWIPWSERLADYKALQAELEAQALLDAEEVEETDGEEDAADDLVIVDVDEDELLSAVPDQGEDAEDDTEDAGERPPRPRSRNRRGNRNKKAE